MRRANRYFIPNHVWQSHMVARQGQERLYRMREPRASYICNFDAKSSSLSNCRGLILDESLIKSIGYLGPTPKGQSDRIAAKRRAISLRLLNLFLGAYSMAKHIAYRYHRQSDPFYGASLTMLHFQLPAFSFHCW